MRSKLDTSDTTFLATGDAEPVLERDTGRPRLDRDGQPQHVVRLVALADGQAEVIAVRLSGTAPKGLGQGTAVRCIGLTITPWSMGDRAGVTYRAQRIEPAAATATAARPTS